MIVDSKIENIRLQKGALLTHSYTSSIRHTAYGVVMSGEDAPRPYLENLIVLEIKTNKQTHVRV
jgi:hypothetical protein